MVGRILDGKKLADELNRRTKEEVAGLLKSSGKRPRLDVLLVGDDPASKLYVGNKSRASENAGIESKRHELPAKATEADVLDLVRALSRDANVHGILVQLPLPGHLDGGGILHAVEPWKDVDGLHSENLGRVLIGNPKLPPCTPAGIVALLDHEKIPLRGADVVIVNHSTLIGKPLAAMLMNRDATVTVCHKATRDLAAHTRVADILVTGTGVSGLITQDHVKRGAVVIDAGTALTKEGKVAGDVRFEEVREVASAITPVPGGVGPMTVAMLLRNTVTAFRHLEGIK